MDLFNNISNMVTGTIYAPQKKIATMIGMIIMFVMVLIGIIVMANSHYVAGFITLIAGVGLGILVIKIADMV